MVLEELLIESEKNKLENPDFVLTRHAHLWHKLILEANITLNILNEKKGVEIKITPIRRKIK